MIIKKGEEKETKNVKKFSLKSYIRDFLIFVDKKLLKTTGILLVISILLIAISLSTTIAAILPQECEGTCNDSATILSSFGSQMQLLFIIALAGVVPYIYAPIVGFIGYVLQEVSKLAYTIKGYGYLAGIGLGIVPLIINVLVICVITALAIYICNNITIGYRISSLKNMNMLNFRIKIYEVIKKDSKIEQLTKKRDDKIAKLQAKKEKINYLQVLNVFFVISIVQFISVLIQEIIL